MFFLYWLVVLDWRFKSTKNDLATTSARCRLRRETCFIGLQRYIRPHFSYKARHTHTYHSYVSLHVCTCLYCIFTHLVMYAHALDSIWLLLEFACSRTMSRNCIRVWFGDYMFSYFVFWTWTWSHMIPYWVPVISVTHSLGFESKRCSYATLHSHSLSRFRRCFPRWFLNIFVKFLSRRRAYGSHDS